MKISPIADPSNSVASHDSHAGAVQSVRTLTMNTNGTPDYGLPPEASHQQAIHTPTSNQEATEEAEVRKPLSPQYAALAKQKRAIQVKERELAEREKALSSQSGQTNSIDLALLKSDPLKGLEKAGVTYQELADQIMANPVNPDVYALKNEIKTLKESFDNKFTERDAQAEKHVLAEMKREAETLARQGDDFEFVRYEGAIPQVMELIERAFREKGEILDVRDAMQSVEEYYSNKYQKAASLKKLQNQQPQIQQPVQRTTGMRTLTNRDTSMGSPLSAKQRAFAAFHGTLQK